MKSKKMWPTSLCWACLAALSTTLVRGDVFVTGLAIYSIFFFSVCFIVKKKIIAPRANQRTLIGENDLHLRSSYQLPRLGHRPLKDC